MNRPAEDPYNPRVLRHPEYVRSYQRYLGQGASADEAARLAYAWTSRTVPRLRTPAATVRSQVSSGALA